MRSVFIGSVESSWTAYAHLQRNSLAPDLVITLPPDRQARHSDYADLGALTQQFGQEVLRTSSANSAEAISACRRIEPDILWVLGWSEIVKAELLSVPTIGTVGAHPSLLPRMRGRAVIPWTILSGVANTGMSLFWLDEGLDTGDIICQVQVPVAEGEDARSLYTKQTNALQSGLDHIIDQAPEHWPRTPQVQENVSYCGKRTDMDGEIDWSRPAEEIWTLIRAVTDPYPGAHTALGGFRLRIWSASQYRGPTSYLGVPGQVQDFMGDKALITCGAGTCLLIDAVGLDGEAERQPAAALLKRHQYLGLTN